MGKPQDISPEFGRLRSFFWPIHRHELKKVLPMLLIFFLITFNFNLLRTMKDTLVITADVSGAEVIPFIKVWFMFPGSILMAFLFTRLSNCLSREYVFYSITLLFILFFAVFTFILYPNRDFFHPNEFCDFLQTILPSGLKGLISAIRNWTFSLFYVMSEVWGNIVLSLLMWGFVNQVTKLSEATRFYAIFGVGINSSGIAAGYLSVKLSQGIYNPNLPFGTSAWEQTMFMLICVVIVAGLLIMAIFRWLSCQMLKEKNSDSVELINESVQGKISMRDSFKYLLKSRYLTYLAIIVITYNIVINLVEVVWKQQVNELYPEKQDYNLYMSYITMIMGISATFMSMFIAGNSVRKFGWSFTAMLTPAILFITSFFFFGLIFAKEHFPYLIYSLTGMTPITLIVFFGSMQNVLSRSAKYTVFDETREMALIPLSADCKLKGKTVIDGVCSRMGKSTGSFVHQSLLLTFSSISKSMPYITATLFSVIGVWMSVTYLLGKKFNSLISSVPEKTIKEEQIAENEESEVALHEQPA